MGSDADRLRLAVCGCGCSTWELRGDGSVLCAQCEVESSRVERWYRIKPAVPDVDTAAISVIRGNGSVSFARERLRRMSGSEDARMLIVALSDGRVSTWFDFETRREYRWMKRRLKDAMRMLRSEKP